MILMRQIDIKRTLLNEYYWTRHDTFILRDTLILHDTFILIVMGR